MVKKLVLLILVFILSFSIAYYYNQNEVRNSSANVQFDFDEFDFDEIKFNDKAEIYFTYKNIGGNNLVINDINTSCGCTVPKWPKTPLSKNQKDSIKINYDTSTLGYFTKEIIVYSNSETSPNHLFIKGKVVKK